MAAEATYSGSRELFLSDNIVVWFPAAILGHHALEMLLKCALIRAGHVIERGDVWGHVLVELAKKLADSCDTFPTHIIDDLAIFDVFFEELRYPRSLDRVDGLGREELFLLGRLVSAIRPFAE